MAFASPMVYHRYCDVWILNTFWQFLLQCWCRQRRPLCCYLSDIWVPVTCMAPQEPQENRSRDLGRTRSEWPAIILGVGCKDSMKWCCFREPGTLGVQNTRFYQVFFYKTCGVMRLKDAETIWQPSCFQVDMYQCASSREHGNSWQFHADRSYHDHTRSGKQINFQLESLQKKIVVLPVCIGNALALILGQITNTCSANMWFPVLQIL